MTDLQAMQELMTRFGITGAEIWNSIDSDKTINLEIMTDCCPKVGGYTGFCSVWKFDTDGKFIKVICVE